VVGDLEHLRLLASAMAGRTLDVATAENGQPSWTDGSTVYVEPDAGPADQVRMLGVQASLLAAGSLAPDIVSRLNRRLARRYLAVEAGRALAANQDVLPPLVRRLIERDVATGPATAEDSLARAASRRPIGDPPRLFGSIHARALLRTVAEGEATTAPEMGTRSQRDQLTELDDDEGEQMGHLLTSPVGSGGAFGRLLGRLLSPTRERGGDGPPGTDAPTHVSARPGRGNHVGTARRASAALAEATGFERQGVAYPEWDVRRRRYRPDWCTVIESEPTVTAGTVSPMTESLALRRALARLGIGLTHVRRQRHGDDIDIDAAVEAQVDTIAGAPHDDDVYVGNLRRRRDLSVLVLLDVSGSAGEAGTAGLTVHEHQRATAAALTATLHGLGDRVALYAFNSRGRQAVHSMRVKAFDDVLDGAAARRLAVLAPGAYTRLGAAIRHGTTILDERAGTARRLLVVLSDGFAYDHGYEGRYGEADAHRALVEARRRGLGCVCLSVGAGIEPAALQRVFGAAAHATVPRVDDLPPLIAPLFRAALGTAEAQQRLFRRTERARERREVEKRTA
jgi:nitric oxide reductase NorD protein